MLRVVRVGPVLPAILGLFLVASPATAQQSSIAGVVRDTSGAVLPGVTVEAASPALIEKVRTAVSDARVRSAGGRGERDGEHRRTRDAHCRGS